MLPIILLHGAIGASAQLDAIAEKLSVAGLPTYLLDFSGHGTQPKTPGPFSIEKFADEVLQLIETKQLDSVNIFGYSMGGFVGMYLAKHQPGKVNKLITLATKFSWSPEIAAREVLMLNADKIEQKLPAFAETLRTRHSKNNWRDLLKNTAEMMEALGNDNPLAVSAVTGIYTPVLLLLGEKDKMVTSEETIAIQNALPNAQMEALTDTPHPIEQVNPDIILEKIINFFQ